VAKVISKGLALMIFIKEVTGEYRVLSIGLKSWGVPALPIILYSSNAQMKYLKMMGNK
jgi:hypothetical protein